MPQLTIERFFCKVEKPKKCMSVENVTDPVRTCSLILTTEKSVSKVQKHEDHDYCIREDNKTKSVDITETLKDDTGFVSSLEEPNANSTDITQRSRDNTSFVPSSLQELNANLRWKKLLEVEDYDKYSAKKRVYKKKRENKPRKMKQPPKNVAKIEINVEALTLQNFTEQLVAMELIKDFLDRG